MTPGHSKPRWFEAAPDEAPPSATAQQLQQIQLLQRRRKVLAAIELAGARNALHDSEARMQESSEALAESQSWTASLRSRQAQQLAQDTRSTRDLLRWRYGDRQLLEGVQAHRRDLEQARDDHARAGDELARQRQRQRRMEITEEKYRALLQDLLEEGRS